MSDKLIEKTQNAAETAPEITTDTDRLMDMIKSSESIQDTLALFNASIAKKQAVRVLKREDIIDKVTERIGERLDRRPDEITMAELTAIDKTMSEQKQKELSLINAPAADPSGLMLHQNNISVTINQGMERESRERVIDAVRELLKVAQESQSAPKTTDSGEASENE